MFDWVRRLIGSPVVRQAEARGRADPEARFVVTVDADRIACRRPSGDVESVDWDDLEFVIIETNDTGPWGADVWWMLGGRGGKGGCAIPQGATGEKQLLEALQRLPGFNNQGLIDAMACTENRRFLCWRGAWRESF
jgi:hypothetical protein